MDSYNFTKQDLEYIRERFRNQLGYCPPAAFDPSWGDWIVPIGIPYDVSISIVAAECSPLYMKHYEVRYRAQGEDENEKFMGFDKAISRAIELYLHTTSPRHALCWEERSSSSAFSNDTRKSRAFASGQSEWALHI
jgi:hypothetical protein